MSPPTKTTNKSNIGNHETTESNQKDDMNHQKDDATASSRTTLKLKRAVPEIVSMEIKQKYQKGLEKQRQLLANLIFPSHIPSPCHPNVSSLAEVIRDLKEILTRKESESKSGGGGGSDSCTSEEKCPTTSSNLFSKQDIELLGRNPRGGTTERFVTPLQEILRVHEKCDVYLRRAKHYEMLAKKQQQNEKLTKENKNALLETVSMSKIFQMNYRYCIASISCPKRVAILNNCYSQYPPEVVQAMVKAGQHEFLCTKERKAVERCCGQKVQSLVRNLHER
jgi:hypothetical protein